MASCVRGMTIREKLMTTYTEQKTNSAFEGDNAAYLEGLYEQYLQDPQSVSPEWQKYFAANFQKQGGEPIHSAIRKAFENYSSRTVVAQAGGPTSCDAQVKIDRLIQAYRQFGHLKAKLDPLSLTKPRHIPALNVADAGLSLNDKQNYDANSLAGLTTANVKTIVDTCEKIYCGPIGFEFEHIDNPVEVQWLRKRIEKFATWQLPKAQKIDLLKKLTGVEVLEKTFGAKYVGVTRFSVEGGDTQVPMLNYLIEQSTAFGVKEAVIGMAHRGRLNVLVNVLGMPSKDVFAQFEGNYAYHEKRSDDVKYHYGYGASLQTTHGPIHASVAFNPSHLEIVSPVVQGMVRARQDMRKDEKHEQVLAVQIHGDSAFAGQGVVMETFAMSQTRGFKIGGSIHIVVNNQVGFTTSNPEDTRSSLYCTDSAKMVSAPIFHVNGDAPEAAMFVAELALAYHAEFHKDVVIDLVCYRRHGHNEGDEPSATQPLMYQIIRKLPTTRKLYADQLMAEKVVTQAEVDAMMTTYRDGLDRGEEMVAHAANPEYDATVPDWSKFENATWQTPAKTALSQAELNALGPKITAIPEGFKVQAQVEKIIAKRAAAYAGDAPLIWGDAELLAYASLLEAGYDVRLVGQDSGRGTFAHRHVVIHDQNTGEAYNPLQHLSKQQAPLTVVDSLLSENAVMACEYGYANTNPHALVLWEAQYGDFCNGAQVVIDQFLSSSEQKWGQLSGLVLLLPHGYEGMGPEHSSARLERFLQLCAQENMQVCNPSTPAQIFHLLRRQVLRPYRTPLVILTPKSMLRRMTSELADVLQGEFQVVIGDAHAKADKVSRVIICSGKVYYDLAQKREEQKAEHIALIRLEQFYPFPEQALTAELAKYKKAKDWVWCQEEPRNQGAWMQVRENFETCLPKGQALTYAGRAAAASTAAGYKKLHEKEQIKLLNEALGI
ncbi:MAG: sucA [Gammaproteobacteria bacterium]|jgi:2-oxoglutarate dehydrogenase E1 component|nr:sucA [Gammaproteobacteria bacterium]